MLRAEDSYRARRRCGGAAEDMAALHLTRHGLKVIARNVRCKAGELDLVCLERALLVIGEVRLRTDLHYGGALGSVAGRKQMKIIRATRFLLRSSPALRRRRVRFDVVALQGPLEESPQLTWIKDAFRAT